MKPRNWPKVEKLYHAALEKPPAEREAFLDQACGGDVGLRGEGLSLLAHEAEAERLLEQPAMSAATQKLAVVRGTRLGPYEIIDLLGAGGMGEVYRARDTRLERDVAIKVLPEHVSHDAAALARFDREARAVAALSHPHIESLFDIGETDGTHYLVMELLEGETLATRLRRGALPEKDALRIGAEIAEALGAAHAHGIVHRDVKPANVMLTRSGVKLLDFGLARLQSSPGPSGETVTTTGPGEGAFTGTLPYMAPEQLEGREADARADIWALGCVLFEMLTGKRAFEGNTQASVIASIEKDEVPTVTTRRPSAPAVVDRLVHQCLKRAPAERWQSAQDLALRLAEIAEAREGSEAWAQAPRRLRRMIPFVVVFGALALLGGVAADRLWLRPRAGTRTTPVVRTHVDLPPEAPLTRCDSGIHTSPRTELALSPDGTRLAWSGSPAGGRAQAALHLYSLESGETRRIAGTEGASQPLFSPDGRWIAFFAQGKLRKVPVEGGLAVDLVDLGATPPMGGPMGASWAPDGRIFLAPGSGLSWVPAEGGRLQEVTTVDARRETSHRLPFVLPGGRALLFTRMPHPWGVRARVEAVVLASGTRKVLVEDCADARYLPTGHLVCARQGALVAAPFDVGRLELTGPAVPVVQGIAQSLNTGGHDTGAAQVAVSASGLLAYVPGGIAEDPPAELLLVDEAGRAEPLPGFNRPLVGTQNRFSLDGRRLAFTERASSGLVWLFDVERGTHVPLSHDGMAAFPQWSPDGTRLVVGWSQAGALNLWLVPTGGGGEWTRLTESEFDDVPSSWSPDGRALAFVRGGSDVFLYRFEDPKAVPFLATPANERYPGFSPDGRWLAYASNESGRHEIYVTSFPDRKQTLVVSREGGAEPAWSRDGRRLFYRSYAEKWMLEVPVRLGETLTLGRARRAFPTPFAEQGPARGYDLLPGGRRFLFTRYARWEPGPPITRLNLVHNWFAELERLCPTRR